MPNFVLLRQISQSIDFIYIFISKFQIIEPCDFLLSVMTILFERISRLGHPMCLNLDDYHYELKFCHFCHTDRNQHRYGHYKNAMLFEDILI